MALNVSVSSKNERLMASRIVLFSKEQSITVTVGIMCLGLIIAFLSCKQHLPNLSYCLKNNNDLQFAEAHVTAADEVFLFYGRREQGAGDYR